MFIRIFKNLLGLTSYFFLEINGYAGNIRSAGTSTFIDIGVGD